MFKSKVEVTLDSLVINSLPEDYIIETLRQTDIYSFNHFYLDENDVELATARDTPQDVENALEAIEKKYYWQALSDDSPEDELIVTVLSDHEFDSDWEAWEEYLEKHLKFPFQVEIVEGDNFSNHGQVFKVHEIYEFDEHYGIMVKGKQGRRTVYYPLCDLEAVKKDSDNYVIVKAYAVWFANS